MRYAEIKDGICVNIMLSSVEFALKKGWVELPDGFGIGDRYENGVFSRGEDSQVSEDDIESETTDQIETE